MIPALVPVNALRAAKSRLRPAVGDATAAELTLAMLADVVAALRAAPSVGPVTVVTPDEQVAAAARKAGAEVLLRSDPGLNAAVDAAATAIAGDAQGLLIVQGDVPGARPDEIGKLVAAAPERGVVLAPSRDGGTSALLRVPPDAIPGGFGPDSARRHRDLAREAGIAFRLLALPSLALDVDDADDLRALLDSDVTAAHTRALLAR